MVQGKENPRGVTQDVPLSPAGTSRKSRGFIFLPLLLFALAGGLQAQTEFPGGDFWSLDAGVGASLLVVDGAAYQFILDPKLWLSPAFMVGTKLGVSYSTDEILSLEGQAYLRWNFLRLGDPQNTTNIFIQGGLGLLASYRGDDTPFDNERRTRGSALFDATLGVTIPLSSRWHIEPQVRGGYPHIVGAAITAGYKFPLPEKTKYVETPVVEYKEVIKTLPPNEIIKRIRISAVEFILFGPDITSYNIGIDRDAQALNELVLNEAAAFLKEHSDYRVRMEGHANPVTTDPREADELMALSTMRVNSVVAQLKARGVAEEQIVRIAFGGTRTVTSDHDKWNRNRRVELIIVHVDTDTN